MGTHVIGRHEIVPQSGDFTTLMRQFLGEGPRGMSAFGPALDIEENADAYTVHAELPGVSADNVSVTLEHNMLKISGEREFYADKELSDFRRVERRFGSFRRSVRLPKRVDPSGVTAHAKDGVLTVAIPKAEESKPTSIDIQVS